MGVTELCVVLLLLAVTHALVSPSAVTEELKWGGVDFGSQSESIAHNGGENRWPRWFVFW